MSRPHWCLILNGKSAGNPAVREAVHALRGRGITLDVRVTWEKGDAERFVAEALAEGVDTVVAAGGDGTLNVVASAFAASGKAADALPSLGLVPMGTANDFATAVGIPRAPLQALELVADAPARLARFCASLLFWAIHIPFDVHITMLCTIVVWARYC